MDQLPKLEIKHENKKYKIHLLKSSKIIIVCRYLLKTFLYTSFGLKYKVTDKMLLNYTHTDTVWSL